MAVANNTLLDSVCCELEGFYGLLFTKVMDMVRVIMGQNEISLLILVIVSH